MNVALRGATSDDAADLARVPVAAWRAGFRFDGTTVVDPEWGAPQVRYRLSLTCDAPIRPVTF